MERRPKSLTATTVLVQVRRPEGARVVARPVNGLSLVVCGLDLWRKVGDTSESFSRLLVSGHSVYYLKRVYLQDYELTGSYYDLLRNEVKSMALPKSVGYITVDVGGCVYALDVFGFTNVQRYDHETDVWKDVGRVLYRGRVSAALNVNNNNGLLHILGHVEGSDRMYMWVYDPSTNEWGRAPPPNVPRVHAKAEVYKGMIFLIAGESTGRGHEALFEEFYAGYKIHQDKSISLCMTYPHLSGMFNAIQDIEKDLNRDLDDDVANGRPEVPPNVSNDKMDKDEDDDGCERSNPAMSLDDDDDEWETDEDEDDDGFERPNPTMSLDDDEWETDEDDSEEDDDSDNGGLRFPNLHDLRRAFDYHVEGARNYFFDPESISKAVELYDPETNEWVRLPELPFRFSRFDVSVVKDRLYVYQLGAQGPVTYWDGSGLWKVLEDPSQFFQHQFGAVKDEDAVRQVMRRNKEEDPAVWLQTGLESFCC